MDTEFLIQERIVSFESLQSRMRIVALILGLAVAAWGGVIAYRALFLEPAATTVINTGTGAVQEYPSMLRVGLGLLLLVCGACMAFFASRRKRM